MITYEREIIDSIGKKMIAKNLTIAAAESVTAGHFQAAISSATEASKFFQGGITVYNAHHKCRHLNVEPIHAEKVNAVSEQVAKQMALGVNNLFISDYSVSITGYATAMPEKGIEEIFAWMAIAIGKEVIIAKKITSKFTDSLEVQIDYANQLLAEINALIDKR